MPHESTQIFDQQEDSQLSVPGNGDLLGSGNARSNIGRVQLLWDGRTLLGRWVGLGFLLSVFLALIIPPKYESATRLMPPENNSESLTMLAALAGKSGDSGLGEIAGDMLGIKNTGALFVGMLHSRTVEEGVVAQLDLRRIYGVRSLEAACKELESRTVIWEDRKSGIIEVRVRDRTPQGAQALGRAYVEQLNNAVNKLSTSAARREREFLEARLVGVKRDLDQASQDFSQFASRNTAIDIPAQGKAMVEAAAVLQGQLMAAEAEEQGLKQIYTTNNIRVRSMESRIVELRRQLDLLGKAGTIHDSQNASTSDKGSTAQNSQDTSTADNSIYPSIGRIPLLGVTYFDLFRRVKIQEALFEALTKRFEMAKVQEAKEIPSVRVLDPADLPERKTTPKRTLIVLFGVFLSLAFGCSWMLGNAKWEQLDSQDSRKLFLLRAGADLRRDWARVSTTLRGIRRNSKSDSGLK